MRVFLRSFGFAGWGVVHAFKTQRNFKVHCGVLLGVVLMGLWLKVGLGEWAMVALAAGLVLQAELVNTALEAIVDHVSPEFHALAKVAKDCAAGAVLVSALAAVIVGLLIFLPKLLG